MRFKVSHFNRETRGDACFDDALLAELRKGWDIVHFSGHSEDLNEDGTFLIVPDSDQSYKPLSIRAVATALGARCRLVMLSSCRAGSRRTAKEMARAGVGAVVGFRWYVDDMAAAEFVDGFYGAFLTDGTSLPVAYAAACRRAVDKFRHEPAWASAIAVMNA